MLILGIESAAKVAGAALYENGRIIAEQMVNGALTHSETLMPMIEAVFQAAGRRPEDLDYIALTSGPGSFTGLRIGAATAKGMALGLRIPLIPVNTLESLAFTAGFHNMFCVPIMDARRGQVYGAVYENGKVVLKPQAISPTELAEELVKLNRPCLFMGDAADLYREQFAAALQENYYIAPAHLKDLRAASVAALAADMLEKGQTQGIPSHELEIDYLRKPQAEREREARLAAEVKS
ncbi:MAG: tRNA (adenosine(37)-N6)-threonylcarbamoyltransferase complex dimerization subunit type 1 TsaB [Firmicutes bacterium]|nr:tRNA (adenosine(37)-N6)-threonylcarbamoyltransferase complex dimerization subunit type 1 TsaB [Bacillota bacterium]